MKTRQVTSNVSPEQYEILQGYKLINIDITESVDDSEPTTFYTYTQIAADINADVDSTIAEHEYEWAVGELKSSDIEIKYHEHGSSRARATKQEWIGYQEALRDYATVSDGVYSLRTEKPVRPEII
jgi:hypothetical protein